MNQSHINVPLFGSLVRLWRCLPARRRAQSVMLVVVMVLASLTEVLSISAVLPFLGVLVDPDRLFQYEHIRPLIALLGITTPRELLLPITIVFSVAALLAGVVRTWLLFFTTRLSFSAGADLSNEIYRRTLNQPYAVHVARNSSHVISAITGKTGSVIYNVLLPLLTVVGSVFLLGMIMTVLLFIDFQVAIGAFLGFGLIYLGVVKLTRQRLVAGGIAMAREQDKVIQTLQEGVGGIRDILLDGSQNVYCKLYQEADWRLRRAQGSNVFLSSAPRFGVESLGMILIAGLAYSMSKGADSVAGIVPVLGALALGAQRMLPVLQQCYVAWASMKGAQASLDDVLALLAQPLPERPFTGEDAVLPFRASLELRDVSFRYHPASPTVLKHLSLVIRKGERLGIMGSTGSGKSTMIDVLMGLLRPIEGALVVDGQSLDEMQVQAWQRHIAHVPQVIYLADSSILENVAFGVPRDQINLERVKMALQQAQLMEMVESLPQKYDTYVGERGVRLSGGQRQRIGIARALYKQADVIVFDEATSALDNETEEAVMGAIDKLSQDLTLVLIAHRLSTLKNCDRLIELVDGEVSRVGSYTELLG